MSSQTITFTGKRFGTLIVQKVARYEGYRVFWLCQCDCGRHAIASDGDLTRERIKSCGREECEATANLPVPTPTYARNA